MAVTGHRRAGGRTPPRLWRWEQLPRVGAFWCGPVLEHYRPDRDVWRELEALVDAEQATSPPGLVWTLTVRRGWLVVGVHAPPERPDYVAPIALFIQAVELGERGDDERGDDGAVTPSEQRHPISEHPFSCPAPRCRHR